MDKKNLNLFLITAAVFFVTLPFINKPAHIDDIFVLYGKEQILKEPLNPYGFDMEFGSVRNSFFVYGDPPLMFYYLALATIFLGKSLTALHISTVIFPLIAAFSMYFLARKFTKQNLYAALILVATPTFMTMSHNFMQDVPIASLFLLSITLFVYGIDKNNNWLLFASAFFAGMAYLMKYTGLLLIPLLVVYALLRKRQCKLYHLLIPISFILLWELWSFSLYGKSHMLSEFTGWVYHAKGVSSGFTEILNRISSLFLVEFSMIGGATLFPLMFLFPFLRKKHNLMEYLVCFALPIPLMVFIYIISKNFVSGQYSLTQLLLLNIFISITIFFIYIIFRYFSSLRSLSFSLLFNKSNEVFLLSWFFITFIANSTIAGGSARYNTLLLPALILIFFVAVEKSRLLKGNQPTWYYSIGFLLTLMLGLAVSIADYQYASAYRDFANSLSQYKTPSNKIWFSGHHDFAYYMEKNGYTMLPKNSDLLQKGDYIIKARLPLPRPITDKLKERLSLVKTESVKSRYPIRVENPYAHAGFYTYGSGFLPYSFSNSNLEDFDIYLVKNEAPRIN